MSSAWKIEYHRRAQKQLKKLNPFVAAGIVKDLHQHLDRVGNPRWFGEAMVGNWTGFWRYRVGDYRDRQDRG